MWREADLQKTPEAGFEETKKTLSELKDLGVAYLDLTGGEPLLREDLPQILKHSKEINFYTTLTTNGLLYPQRAKEITQFIDRLIFSLDSPASDEHDRIRGAVCFDKVLESVKIAKSLGKTPVLNFTLTRESVASLPEMATLAEELGCLLWVNPVFDFESLNGFEADTIDHIKYFGYKSNVAFNLAALAFIKASGNNEKRPRCRAALAVITVTPDNCLMVPCIKNKEGKIKIEGSLKETLLASKKLSKMSGRLVICRGCMMWPYMIPSFLYKIDRYFFLNLWSAIDLYRKEYLLKKGGKK
jgi:MoaA/NifB/PqqE/SkfB family radical SAM enzyme